jgi:hypothetical protein
VLRAHSPVRATGGGEVGLERAAVAGGEIAGESGAIGGNGEERFELKWGGGRHGVGVGVSGFSGRKKKPLCCAGPPF